MGHQAEDVERLSAHPRINIFNGLGTGKCATACWWLQSLWWRGIVDEAILVLPSMCAMDWRDSLCGLAWPEGLVDFWDCRPPDAGIIADILSSRCRAPPGRLRVLCTTYGGIRSIMDAREPGSRRGTGRTRWRVDPGSRTLAGARGRGLAALFDESQAAALQSSNQGAACQAIADASRAVASISATPIGNPLAMRLWGMTRLVRRDILERQPVPGIAGRAKRGSFVAFKARYGYLQDPVQMKAERAGRKSRFVAGRAYPVSIHDDMIRREILEPMAPFTTIRLKEDCLDLPPKVRMRRRMRLPPAAERVMRGLIDDDRAVLGSGTAVVPENVLVERLRTLELCGGWVAGEPVHDGKLCLLRDVLAECGEALGEKAPLLIWASRSREVVAAALVAAGMRPKQAMDEASAAYLPGGDQDPTAYRRCVDIARRAGVGIIHGPTPDRDRDRIQSRWRSGALHRVVAHPGVAGAGLNWQHVVASLYYSQPLGTIARQQSEDRVHRHGLDHTALYYDLTVEDGPDEAVAMAHAEQRDAAAAMLAWISWRYDR